MFSLKSLFFLQILLLAVWGQTAHRVDDDDAQITYTPLTSWHRNEESNPHDEGGFHMVTDDATATATFSFTGVCEEFKKQGDRHSKVLPFQELGSSSTRRCGQTR
ncbi:hypothetical protein FA13DRAFT_1731881 [Coprinellus micaceus]|uniref:Uncharacterized protein n=1 Tax=Coprinellus micaceus TaxID=71717 RepID=A0A4Y7TF03_COPMI|nr:hypothetical protein FA13DRAFT_1731881 [Coprinellus micaceus]